MGICSLSRLVVCGQSHHTCRWPSQTLTNANRTLTLTVQPPGPNPNPILNPHLQVRDIKAHIWGQICGCPTGQAGELITVDADKGTLACYRNTGPGMLRGTEPPYFYCHRCH